MFGGRQLHRMSALVGSVRVRDEYRVRDNDTVCMYRGRQLHRMSALVGSVRVREELDVRVCIYKVHSIISHFISHTTSESHSITRDKEGHIYVYIHTHIYI